MSAPVRYWLSKTLNKELSRSISSSVKKYTCTVTADKLAYYHRISNSNNLPQFCILSTIYSFLLKRYFPDFPGVIASFNSFTKEVGSDKPFFMEVRDCDESKTLKEYLYLVTEELKEILTHMYYDDRINNLDEYSSYGIYLNTPFEKESRCKGLSLDIATSESGLTLTAYYAEAAFQEPVVRHLISNFVTVLVNLQQCISQEPGEIQLLTPAEKKQVLEVFNNTFTDFPKNKTIISLVEEQVKKTPDNVAVCFKDQKLTYRELNKKANQLATWIKSYCTIAKEPVIAVVLQKSDDAIIAFLAILKLGGVYLPVDPAYPRERINYILQDSKASLVIINSALTTLPETEISTIDLDNIVLDGISVDNPQVNISPDDLAYLIYTSGTTGKPKGVLVQHNGNVNMSLDQVRKFNITSHDKVVWFASVSFDASISEIMMVLYTGATLVIPTEEVIKDQSRFISFLEHTKATVVTLPPSYLNFIDAKDIKGIRCLITAGEAANPVKVREIADYGIACYNAYGPTEYSVCATIYRVSTSDMQVVPIGHPIANTYIYILDNKLRLVPIGVCGRIYISGAGLARGYLGKPELTKEKFIGNPYLPGQKMYDTGDLGKWLPDGIVEFMGREDSQVKIRGYRIELGEIESCIYLYSSAIKHVVVEPREINGERTLIGYYVTESPIDKTTLKKHLQQKLPEYMVPGFYVSIDSIPLTPNGKIDRKSLPAIREEDIIRKPYAVAETRLEQALVEIWQEVLGIKTIGVEDNFFELGGHSLMIGQVINRINQKLVQNIGFKNFFNNPTIRGIGKELEEAGYTPIPKAPEMDSYPLTSSQRRLWIISQLEGGSQAYNMSAAMQIDGLLNEDYLDESFHRLIQRHEILRTYFKAGEGSEEIRQFIVNGSQIEFKIEKLDFSEKEDAIRGYLEVINNKAFDLEKCPPIRALLIRVSPVKHIFSICLHHIAGDGWSLTLLLSEFIEIYNALMSNVEATLPRLAIQYKDYALWLNTELQQEKYLASAQFWKQQMKAEIPVLKLPGFKPRPLQQTYNGSSITHHFSKEFLKKIKAFSQNNNVTLFMTLMAGIRSLIYRYTQQQDIIIGTPITARNHPDLENQVGLYLNTLAIRSQFADRNKFIDVLMQERDILLAAYEHKQYPFDELINQLDLKRDRSRSPLFDVMVVLQSQAQVHSIHSPNTLQEIRIKDYYYDRKYAQFDISFMFTEGEDLKVQVEYNTDIYDAFLIQRIFDHFGTLLLTAIENPELLIEDVNYQTEEELQQLLSFNGIRAKYPGNKTVVEIFEEQVAKSPDNPAVVFEGNTYTYKELNVLANMLGSYLREKYNIGANDLVSIKLERSDKMVLAVLGTLKSGAAYVPLDLAYPESRLEYIQNDTQSKVTIDEEELTRFYNEKDLYSNANPVTINSAEDLVYVIYTSGTTGNPKGVMMQNKSILNLLWYHIETISGKERTAQLANISFDVSFQEIFTTLLSGSCLYPVTDMVKKDIDTLIHFIINTKITSLFLPTAYFKLLTESRKFIENTQEYVKNFIVAGEQLVLNDHTLQQIKKFGFTIYNHYGPAETHVVSEYKINKLYNGKNIPPIGRPIWNINIYILDTQMQPVPIGVIGKLYLSGPGVAMGYLNKPALTAERFMTDPFRPGSKMYDTGDLGRWLPDGNIEFCGRKDYQIKIRGFRIEIEEIETTLLQYSPDIRQVVVEAKDINGEKTLAAYFVSDKEVDKQKLREFIAKRLPEYMIPHYYIALESLPLTSNGKLDRNALPFDANKDLVRKTYVAPGNILEEKLVQIWEQVLDIKGIGVTDVFFEMGGHSLKAIQLIDKYRSVFNVKIGINDIFNAPTIVSHANLINRSEQVKIPEIQKAQDAEDFPVSDIQKGIWIACQFNDSYKAYQIPFFIELTINEHNFKRAFASVVQRHEILRTTFRLNQDGELRQVVIPADRAEFSIEYHDLRGTNKIEEVVSDYIFDTTQKDFDFEKGPLFKSLLLKISDTNFIFCLTMHHLICDKWSVDVLKNDVLAYYKAYEEGSNVALDEVRFQYKDYIVWTRKYNNDKAHIDYWLNKFAAPLPRLDLFISKQRPALKTFNGKVFKSEMNTFLYRRLSEVAEATNTTLFMNLLSIVYILLYRYSEQEDIIIGSPMAGRAHPGLADKIGCFVNTIALRISVNNSENYNSFLARIKKMVLEGHEHQSVAMEALIEKLEVKRDVSRSPLFDASVVMVQDIAVQHDIIPVEDRICTELSINDSISKYDITFFFEIIDDKIVCNIAYNTDLFEEYAIEKLFSDFLQIAELITKDRFLTIDNCLSKLLEFNTEDKLFFNDAIVPIDDTF